MKKILFAITIMLISVCSFAQIQRTTNDGMTYSTYQTYKVYSFESQDTVLMKMSPGQMLEKAGKLKNTAIGVGLGLTAVSMAVTIPTACGAIDATTGYIIGGVIGFAGLVSVLAIEVKSNKLIKEAGRRMTMIEIKGNGVNIRF